MIWLATFLAVASLTAAWACDAYRPHAFRPWRCAEARNVFIGAGVFCTVWAWGLAVAS